MAEHEYRDSSSEQDQELLRNVRPSDWKNPEPAGRYNLVVIGAGTAGLVAAAGAAGLGAKVALVEQRLLGGDCLHTGCVPSKALIRAGRALHDIRQAAPFGVVAREVSFDFGKAMERMRRLRADLSGHDSAARFSRELGVDVFLGSARFLGPDSIDVSGTRLVFSRAAVCTGSRPAVPAVPGLAETGYLTNETVFRLAALPRRLAILGGGPMGCELAQVFTRMGSRVTLLERGPQLLPREDREAAALVQRALEREGVRVLLAARVLSATGKGATKSITLQGAFSEAIEADEILIAAGRQPNIEGLDLEKAGVPADAKRGVIVDDRLRTANRRIYAAGDVCSPMKFTHAADAMARIVIANALFHGRQRFSSLLIPSCVYTDPEVAHVGMTHEEAERLSGSVAPLVVPFDSIDRAVLDGETEGFAKVYLRKGTDRVLGATIVGSRAAEMLNELTLAMVSGKGLATIARTIHPYPTHGEAVRKLADQYQRSRLSPSLKTLLARWFAWQR